MQKKIAVIGAGPAGSLFTEKLAQSGINSKLFDHKAPWDKPCGGLLHMGTVEEFSFFKDYPYEIKEFNRILFISPDNQTKYKNTSKPIHTISRLEFSDFLLKRAISTGVEFIPERVNRIEAIDNQWRIFTDAGVCDFDVLVGADGATSLIRKTLIGKIPSQYMGLTCGYNLEANHFDECIIKYLDLEGYIWIFPGPTHTSAGIGTRLGTFNIKDLYSRLDQFLVEKFDDLKKISKWNALVPVINDPEFFEQSCASDNWLLLGDAAGHVNPATGDGLNYALKSARLAAKAVLDNDPIQYNKLWQESYGHELKAYAEYMKTLGEISGGSNLETVGTIMYNNAVYEPDS